ncbi:hypothetical protein TNCV_1684361 [Trichonephila clavipes]|nr:hypothetical protein TNCV_1684361 [Trichonephila clavipes]
MSAQQNNHFNYRVCGHPKLSWRFHRSIAIDVMSATDLLVMIRSRGRKVLHSCPSATEEPSCRGGCAERKISRGSMIVPIGVM